MIRSSVPPEAAEGSSYRIPTFRYQGSLLGYAVFTNHCSLFPMSPAVGVALKEELKSFRTCKGTVQFRMAET